MMPRVLAVGPPVLLGISVLVSRLSGNDKSPFIVLLVVVLLVALLVGALVMILRGGPSRANAVGLTAGTALTLLYVGLALLMARLQVIDLQIWLGFR